ncbi:unnamed protein product [Menidia menidia]|uniref:(Atlantic silverside) hypothetical protein n=1 Tax=Menidia menidia TaxID=238744 RepID=A0A8S4BP67_9TELE|nr:unnamed protein product [Menidia menidia]
MWCYQKPDFEGVLLSELQRQQQCSQFCDTLLKAGGVSVPAHSCVLSAVSPHISSALSAMPAPPAGQSRLLEFQALGACTLLHMVRLLYSGQMMGEGESEKREAISAAAKLGIGGLVEVPKSKSTGGGVRVGQCVEVGVQTEPERTEEPGPQSGWRRELRDGGIFLWKETPSGGEKEVWTQTEEPDLKTAPPVHPPYETVDMEVFRSLQQADCQQFVPVTVIYPPSESQILPPLPAAAAPLHQSAAAGNASVDFVVPPHTSAPPSLAQFPNCFPSSDAVPQSCWSGYQAAGREVPAAEEWEDVPLEQFQDNIPGFISYFLNPEDKDACRGRRARRRQRVRGGRRSGTGEQRARTPRGGARGRGRGGATELLSVQEVGVGKLQKLFLHRWNTRTPRTGLGAGAVGRTLFLKSRESLKSGGRCPRRRGPAKEWDPGRSGDLTLPGGRGGGGAQWGRKNATQQDCPPVSRTRRGADRLAPAPPSVPPRRPPDRSGPSLQPAAPHSLVSPAAPYASPAPSLLHTTALPPPAPPPPEDHPERIERLLEEVMMGLDILPHHKGSGGARHSPPAGGSAAALSRQRGPQAATEAPVLQQPCEGELSEMLDQFLQSFEQHVENERGADLPPQGGQPQAGRKRSHRRNAQSRTPDTSDGEEASQSSASSESTERVQEKARGVSRRRAKRRMSSQKIRKAAPSDSTQKNRAPGGWTEQLQKTAVVELDRRSTLSALGCLGAGLQSPAEAERNQSSGRASQDSMIFKERLKYTSTKTYPIRSRFRKAPVMSNMSAPPEPLPHKPPPPAERPARHRGRPPKKVQRARIQPEGNQERPEQGLTAQPREAADEPAGGQRKRGAESRGDLSEGATAIKRVCSAQNSKPASGTPGSISESAAWEFPSAASEPEEVIDIETISLASSREHLSGAENKQEPALGKDILGKAGGSLTGEDTDSSTDDIIDVEGVRDSEDKEADRQDGLASSKRTANEAKDSLARTLRDQHTGAQWEEDEDQDGDHDIDVIGASSPVPDPVVIIWTESSEEEREELIDVVGEKTDRSSSAIFSAAIKGELVNRKALSH